MIVCISIQFTFRFCGEMKKYKLLLFLFILPTISTSKFIKKRRRPSVDAEYPILDQIAQANTWQSPNRVISASYLRNADTGHVNNANLMINLLPHQTKHQIVDMAASETLSNAQSAAEYVTRALNMRNRLRDKAPHSSYVKYDVYEKEQMQHLNPSNGLKWRPTRHNPNTKSDAVTRNSKIYEDYEYRNPKHSHDFGDSEYMYKESDHKFNGHYQSSHNSDNYDNFKSDMKSEEPYVSPSSDVPKSELVKHIEKSVLRYMKRLESEGNLPKVSTHRPHTEIKTYYRLPTLNSQERIKDHTEYQSTESQLFTPSPTKHHKTYKSPLKESYSTITPYPEESYTTAMSVIPNIDLTFRSKGRPKPIDLSALDVGQSWSHGSSLDQSRHPTKKPKLKFNSQAYQDINSMTYLPERGLIQESSSYTESSDGYPYVSTEANYSGAKIRDGIANVAASIAVREKNPPNSEEAMKDLEGYYRKPLQIVNGVPILNPYKFNVDALKHMLGGDPENLHKQQPSNWHPYDPTDNRYKSQKEINSVADSYHHNQHDSYNPKYNNNPEGQGYQDNWEPSENSHRQRGTIGSDMYSSSSSNLPKKIRGTTVTIHKHKGKKHKNKTRTNKSSRKNRNIQTELRPPPAAHTK